MKKLIVFLLLFLFVYSSNLLAGDDQLYKTISYQSAPYYWHDTKDVEFSGDFDYHIYVIGIASPLWRALSMIYTLDEDEYWSDVVAVQGSGYLRSEKYANYTTDEGVMLFCKIDLPSGSALEIYTIAEVSW
ncbi:MAG: hypothetical protein PVH88_06425 [Ignavibacteria bacterium]|jgi:hypothetical protein